MSKMINVCELSFQQQDTLWSDHCPNCGAKIFNAERSCDYAQWNCRYCDITYICE